jgi:glycosyltransferase involved in cell wall biosynthesis
MEHDLKNMVADFGLQERVHFAGMWPDTSVVFPALDIVAQSSRDEGMPLALLEAMACGRPVVALATGGVIEVVEMNSSGLIVGEGNWQGLGEALIDLVDHPDKRGRMGAAGRQRAEQRFDLADTVNQTATLFRRLANFRARYQATVAGRWPTLEGTP